MKKKTLGLLLLGTPIAIVIVALVVGIVQILQEEPVLLLVIMVATIGVTLIVDSENDD